MSFFALIHIPVDEQSEIIQRIGDRLRPKGFFLATVGRDALTRTGSFYVVEHHFIPEDPHGGHELVFGERRTG